MYADAAVFASSRLKPARARYVTVEIDPQLMRANTSPVSLPGTQASRTSTQPSIASTMTLTPSVNSHMSLLSPTTSSAPGSISGNIPSIPVGSNNIINKKADPAQGLFQTCVVLRERLKDVPEFDRYLDKDSNLPPDEAEDPVAQLWRVFQKGSSLCWLFNSLRPHSPIADNFLAPDLEAVKFQKQATFYFLKGIQDELGLSGDNAFMISHLYSEDTNGFVKVTKTVSRILDELEERGLLRKRNVIKPDLLQSNEPLSNRAKVVKELVDTERKYVQDLEALQDYMTTLYESGVVTADFIHMMFLNLNSLVDFQRRFLIRVETLNALPAEQQRWGKLFVSHETSFEVYQPYCANFKTAQDIAYNESARLAKVSHPVSTSGVAAFLIKPVQRICKYPLLLRDMIKYSESDEAAVAEITTGMDSIERVNAKVNEAIRKADMLRLVDELKDRVDDWKGHKLDQLGSLLLHGQFTITKGDAKGEVEREYHIYLFETILLCCKEIPIAKGKSKKEKRGVSQQSMKAGSKDGKPNLQLKGRIYAKNITHIISLAKNGSYTLQIFWRGDSSVENFIIRHRNEESLNQWKKVLTEQYNLINEQGGGNGPLVSGRAPATANLATEFMWPSIDKNDDNNTLERDDNSDQDDGFTLSRSASQSDLKSQQQWPPQPTEPVPPQPQLPRTNRFNNTPNHIHTAPLTLNTSRLMNSPPNMSYFSPINETPSTGARVSGAYPFPRQSTPNYEEQQTRYQNGLPMQRQPSRENSSSSLAPGSSTTRLQRPSLPGMAPSSNQAMLAQQQRSRSASSPQLIRPTNGAGAPATPAIPHQYQPYQYPSGNGVSGGSPTSPLQSNGVPFRNGSPSIQIENGRPTRSQMPPQVKVRVSYGTDVFVIIVPYSITYKQLMDRIEHKVSICGGVAGNGVPLKIKYQDEDGDYISMSSDDDVQMAFDVFCDPNNGEGTVGVVTLCVVT